MHNFQMLLQLYWLCGIALADLSKKPKQTKQNPTTKPTKIPQASSLPHRAKKLQRPNEDTLPATGAQLQLEILEIYGKGVPINIRKCLKILFEPCLVFHTIKSLSLERQWTKPHVLCPGTETSLFALWGELKHVPLQASHGPLLQLSVWGHR